MKKTQILLTITALTTILLTQPAQANWIGAINLTHGETSTFAHYQQARVTYDFKVTTPDGAFLAVQGYHEGTFVTGQVTGVSASHPAGTEGSSSNYLMFESGEAVMDEIRVQMIELFTFDVLLEMRLPVDYRFGPHSLNNIDLSTTSPGWLRHEDDLFIDIDYQTDEPGGVRISARPYTEGALTPGYAASGSALSPVGDGVVGQFFRFAADAVVDEVRIEMWNADNSSLLLEVFRPVDLRWTNEGFTNITFDPPGPACLGWDQQLYVELDYATSDHLGCYVFAQALDAAGDPIPGQDVSASSDMPVTGHATRWISFPPVTGEGEVAFVKLIITSNDPGVTLQEVDYPVTYSYGPNAVGGMTFYPAPPTVLDYGEFVETTFTYVINEPGGVRIFGRPYSYDGLPLSYAYSGSPLYMGSGIATGEFSITDGPVRVTGLHMSIRDMDGIDEISACLIPGDFTFGGVGGVTAVGEVPAAEGPVLGQNFPNPFNPVTSIPVDMTAAGRVVLKVYDLRGRLMRDLADSVMPAGRTLVPFDGTGLASGTYFYAIETPQGRQGRRMQLIK